MSFERKVSFAAAYDKTDPNPRKNYGVHGVHIDFTLKGAEGGITFGIATNWHLPHVQAKRDAEPLIEGEYGRYMFHKPTPFGVAGHWKVPQYEGQTPRDSCSVTDGVCYCDGSALMGDEVFQALVEGGDEAMWKKLEQVYEDWKPK